LKKKVKKLRNAYNHNYRQVTTLLLLLVCIFVSSGCGQSKKLAVTYEREAKKGERDGAHIDSLYVEVVKKLSNGGYIVAYSISGQITEEYWHSHMMLKKVRLTEEDSDTPLYDKRITLTPVQESFFGKAAANPEPFHIRNEYTVKNNSKNPLKKIMFSSGGKEFLLELK